MIIVTCFALAIYLGISIIKWRNLYNPLTIFCTMWLIICFLAELKLFGMYNYSFRAPLVILIGATGMFLGCILGRHYKLKLKRIPFFGIDPSANYVLREKIYVVLLAISIIVYGIMASSIVGLLASGYSASTILLTSNKTCN